MTTSFWLSAYILVWPVIAAAVMVLLSASIVHDIRTARREGRDMV